MATNTITITRAEYAEEILYLDGAPFSVAAVPFMRDILNCTADEEILQTARQVGKSTTLSASILTGQTATPHYRTLYVAPRNEQVMQFSKDRLSHMITGSPFIAQNFVDSSVQQQVKAKEFTNGSMTFLRSCYHTADGLRGISANDVYIDEMQDILIDNIPVIQECTSRKAIRKMIYCGTPKTFDNPIAQYWEQSSQNYWAVKCCSCRHWNVPLDLTNVGDDSLICSKCGKPLDALKGQYVSTYPDRKFVGFHVSQTMIYGVPGTGLPWSRLTDKLNDPLYSVSKIQNECLGFSYDSGSKLITETDLIKCCNSQNTELKIERDADWGIKIVCAGVDWGVLGGNTHTILVLGGINKDGKLQVFFAKKFPVDQDPIEQCQEIAGYINRAGVALTCADRGGGHTANSFLRKALAFSRLAEIEYKHKVLEGMTWNAKSKTWVTDRTRALAGIVIDIKRQDIEFPAHEVMGLFFPDLLTLSCEYNDKIRAYQILRQASVPDDFAHGLTYLRLAAKKLVVKPTAQKHNLESFIPPMRMPDDPHVRLDDI